MQPPPDKSAGLVLDRLDPRPHKVKRVYNAHRLTTRVEEHAVVLGDVHLHVGAGRSQVIVEHLAHRRHDPVPILGGLDQVRVALSERPLWVVVNVDPIGNNIGLPHER